MVMIRLFVIESPRRRDRRMDCAGPFLGTVALAALTSGLIEAGQLGWTERAPLTPVLGGLLVTALFVLVEQRLQAPMLPSDAHLQLALVLGGHRGVTRL